MSDQKKIAAVRDLIESAQKSIVAARKILGTLAGEGGGQSESMDLSGLTSYKSGDEKIIE
jgi:hypothetical protein